MKKQCSSSFYFNVGLFCTLFFPAFTIAYEATTPKAPVPAHSSPWIETKQQDVDTLFLWKFLSDEDRGSEILNELDLGDSTSAKKNTEGRLVSTGSIPGAEPVLKSGARPKAKAGRFGGGLELDGTGYAEGTTDLSLLLREEGGFTFDFWFRQPNSKSDKAPETLLALFDRRNRPFVTIASKERSRVVLTLNEKEKVVVPFSGAPGAWHHMVFTVQTPRGQSVITTLILGIDGERVAVEPCEWLQELSQRLGPNLAVGGADGLPGLEGVVDEVRLTKGVKNFYPWNLSAFEFERSAAALELKSPHFRGRKVLTQFHFDGSLEPEVFAGNSWTGKSEDTFFQRGIQGQALDLSQIEKSGFEMNGFNILPDKEGTLEFWFRPLDWNNFYVGGYAGEGVKVDWLLTLKAKDSPYDFPTKNIDLFRGRAGRDMQLHWQKFHPGTWTHVLISINDGKQSVYLNGLPQKLWQTGLVTQGHPYAQEPLQKWLKRTGGKDDGTWTLAFKPSATLVDEFSVYEWPLSPDEAWNAYARWLPDAAQQMKPLPVLLPNFDYFAHSWNQQERLVTKLTCLQVGDDIPSSADIEIRAADESLLLKVEQQGLDSAGNTSFTLQQPLTFGRYAVTVRSRNARGEVLKQAKLDYVRNKPDWLGNDLGTQRTVPKPWTPIRVEGSDLRVVGRKIVLGANGLPTQIEALRQNLLSAPVTISATTNQGVRVLAGKGIEFEEVSADRTCWRADMEGVGLKAKLDAKLEFDGLVYCEVTLKPEADSPIKLEELDIDFPLDSSIASQLLANGGGQDFRRSWIARTVPAGQGSVWNSLDKPYPAFTRALGVTNFMPHIWIGGDEVGLYFGGENDRGWTVDGPKPAQEILRQEGALVFRMNVIREPVNVTPEGHRFHFVLLPTPAKPEPADWRKQMLAGGVNFGACDTFGGFDLKTDPADANPGDSFLLEPRSWEHAAKMAPQCRAKWGRCILYADASWPGLGPSFRDWGHDLWAGTGRVAWSPEFEDYSVWAVNQFLKRNLIDGIYWDDVSVGHTLSLASTAYEHAGSENGRRVGFTALAQRRVNMRLWRLFEAAGKEPCIWAHMTVCYEVPVFSFCRYLSNGEFVTGVDYPNARDAMDFWDPETLRILGGSAKWGAGVSFLSTLPRSLAPGPTVEQWAYPQRRTESALFITSDVMTMADGLGRKLIDERVFDGEVKAIPWWKSHEILKVTAPANSKVLTSVYVVADRAILVIANRDRDPKQGASVEVDAKLLFPKAKDFMWRDLDPGLKPPKVVAASQEEIDEAQPGSEAVESEAKNKPPGEILEDLIGGITPKERTAARAKVLDEKTVESFKLQANGSTVKVLVRPRDYRVLELRPTR